MLDRDLGWEGFRKDYGAETWQWITAAMKPRLIQPIESKLFMENIKVSACQWIPERVEFGQCCRSAGRYGAVGS